MERGTNSWNGSGIVCSDVVFNETTKGDQACGFRIAINKLYRPTFYIRVNAYGSNAEGCRKMDLSRGDCVIVDGELMSRMGREEQLTEVRCREIVIRKMAKNQEDEA